MEGLCECSGADGRSLHSIPPSLHPPNPSPPSAPQVVLAPVLAGATINTLFAKQAAALAPLSGLSAVALISLICGSVLAANAAAVLAAGPRRCGA